MYRGVKMKKRILAALLSLMIMLTAVLPSNAYGLNWEVKDQTEFMQNTLKSILGFSEGSDLTIDKSGAKVENKVYNNIYITKNVKNGKTIISNVVVTGGLFVEGTGQNSVLIENSTVKCLTVNKEDGSAKITVKGTTEIDAAKIYSDTILEQQSLSGSSLKDISIYKNISLSLKTDKKNSWSLDKKIASINSSGEFLAKDVGEVIIYAKNSGSKSEFCKIKIVEPEIPTIKILAIGNSFSNDSLSMVYDIAKSAGIEVVVANLNFNGCSLQTHWINANSNNAYYTYQKWMSDGMSQKPKQTMKKALLDEDWDYIILQQYSGYSGIYSTFKPYLNYLASYVKGLSPNSKLALNMTWAYASDSSHADFASYKKNQDTMYKAIAKTYQQAADESKIDIIIPCGTSIQNARTYPNLKSIGDELTRDGFHLDEKMGRYIAGLTVFETLIINEKKINIDLYDDVTFIPGEDQDKKLIKYAKDSVMDAVKKPFKTTSFKQK
jgi:hypothetical protein